MGVVYISREANEDRFTVGAAKSLPQRKRGGYTRYNPRLKTYRVLKTADHFALEKFLHLELAEKRILEITSDSWYAVTSNEIDIAIERAKTFGRAYLDRKKKVAEFKNVKTDGRWLEPNERLKEIYNRLSRLTLEKQTLLHEENILRLEAMAYIENADGVDGLFQWPSHEQRKFQTKIFSEKHPDLYDAFRRLIYVRKFNLWGSQEEDDSEDTNEQD